VPRLQTFLPEAVHRAFEVRTAEFLLKPWEAARAAAAANGLGEGGTQVCGCHPQARAAPAVSPLIDHAGSHPTSRITAGKPLCQVQSNSEPQSVTRFA